MDLFQLQPCRRLHTTMMRATLALAAAAAPAALALSPKGPTGQWDHGVVVRRTATPCRGRANRLAKP